MSETPSEVFGGCDSRSEGFFHPTVGDFWRAPLPHQAGAPLDRGIMRAAGALLSPRLLGIGGLEHIDRAHDPFIFVANHNQRMEAPILPTLLFFRRQGLPVRFVADWPMKIVPGFARCYHIGRMITVTRKDARPRWLNVFRPLFHEKVPAFERTLEALRAGDSVGIFAEGVINRHPSRLLRGRTGAARLALTVGVPVVPAGIRFPDHDGRSLISDSVRLEIDIGEPIPPPAGGSGDEGPDEAAVEAHHHTIMRALERLSKKAWDPEAPSRRIPLGSDDELVSSDGEPAESS